MVAARRIIAVSINADQRRALAEISRSRTEPANRVERACIVLAYLDNPSAYAVSRRIGLGPQDLREVLYDLPGPPPDRRRSTTPCPLSSRELEVLKRLAEGKVYKQIALELSLSTSTVRTHLHNTYTKLGAVDRAQAVLLATQRGWL